MGSHAHALVDSIVFAVDGKNGNIALARRGGKDFARRNHALLVGQSHWLSGKNGRVRRPQS